MAFIEDIERPNMTEYEALNLRLNDIELRNSNADHKVTGVITKLDQLILDLQPVITIYKDSQKAGRGIRWVIIFLIKVAGSVGIVTGAILGIMELLKKK